MSPWRAAWPTGIGFVMVNHRFLAALHLEFGSIWIHHRHINKEIKVLDIPGILRVGTRNLMLLFSKRKWLLKMTDPKAPLHAQSLPFPLTPSSIYLCFSRAAQNLTQYILPGKWNKEVCLQLGLDGDHLLDVFQGLLPLSFWRHCCCFCFSYSMSSLTLRQAAFWRFGKSFRRRSTLMLKTCTVLKSRKTDPWLNGTAWFFPPTEVLGK